MLTLPPNLEVINGKVVITVSTLLEFIKRIVANVIARSIYDWLKNYFKGGD